MDGSPLGLPPSLGFSRQEHWSGLPFPSPGDLSDPRIKPMSLASPALVGRFFTSWATREAIKLGKGYMNIFSQQSSIQQIFSQQSSIQQILIGCLPCARPEKAMATHSSTLAWKIPWMEEAGSLRSMGSLGSQTQLSNFTFTFHFHALVKETATNSSVLAWKIPGMGVTLVGCHLWDHTELDTTEHNWTQQC